MVDDQVGRLTFTSELARAIRHLTETTAPYGVYNVTGAGPVRCWADIARRTFVLAGHDPNRLTAVSNAAYFGSAIGPVAPRPACGVFELTKIESTGVILADADELLENYVRSKVRTMLGATTR